MKNDNTPPETVYYAPGVGRSLFYRALKGIRSATKTSSQARFDQWDRQAGRPSRMNRRVWRGTVTWVEIDLDTGKEIVRESDALKELGA